MMTVVYHVSHSLSTAAELHVVITLLLLYPTLKWVSGTSGPALSITSYSWELSVLNTLRTGLLNCLNARSRGLNFRHRASCILCGSMLPHNRTINNDVISRNILT